MKTKFFTLSLTILLGTIGVFPSTKIGNLYYNLDSSTKTAEVTSGTTKYTGSVSIPSSVTYSSVSYKVTSIGKETFLRCTEVTSVSIPASIDTIVYNAFELCSGLTSISVNAGNPKYSSVNGVLFNKDKTLVILYPGGKTGTYTIPDSVGVCLGAFRDCYNLSAFNVSAENPNYSVVDGVLFNKEQTELIRYPMGKVGTTYVIPESVVEIGQYAFKNCSTLTSISISESVQVINKYAFQYCVGITHISLPKRLKDIGSAAFYNSGLSSITIPDSVTHLGFAAFRGTNLNRITIGKSVSDIDSLSFSSCSSLRQIFNRSLTPQIIVAGVFKDVDQSTCELCVFKDRVSAFKNSLVWKDFKVKSFNTLFFDANGGVIPPDGNMGLCPNGYYTTLNMDRSVGSVSVVAGQQGFRLMAGDCPIREGYTFEGWFTDSIGGEQVYDEIGCYVTGNYWDNEGKWIGTSNVTLYAHWTPIPYTITVTTSSISQGTATGGGTYDYGTNHQLTATPSDCYAFTQWSDGNTDNPRTITVTGDITYTAEFTKINYTIKGQNASSAGGSVQVVNP